MLLLTRIAFGQAVFAPVKDAEWPPVPLFMVQRNDSVFVLTDKGLTLLFLDHNFSAAATSSSAKAWGRVCTMLAGISVETGP
jgi:hypothetical protein